MEISVAEGESLRTVPTLWEALFPRGVGNEETVSFVGAGGKSTLIRALAGELTALGKRVIVTTTTHMYRPWDGRVVLTGGASVEEALGRRRWEDRLLYIAQEESGGKLKGLSPDAADSLSLYGDVVLVEADGAKRMPLKVPEEWEPVLPATSKTVVACAGLDSIGEPLRSVCFRWEKASSLFGLAGEEPVEPETLAAFLASRLGGRKAVGNRDYRIVLNKADCAGAREKAVRTAACIRRAAGGEKIPCIVSSLLGEL